MTTVLAWALLLALDGGSDAGMSHEDQEVIDNLELLQNLDSAADLELLQELSVDR
ncbi:MAG: hypothetical protein Q8L48_05400 [Archangium sp.]|nr:hypothetical protein [Archangium sp.]